MITTQIDDLVGRPTGVKTQAFLYVLCGLAEAAVYVALLPLLRSLIAGDYVAAGYLVALAAALALLHSVIGFFADNPARRAQARSFAISLVLPPMKSGAPSSPIRNSSRASRKYI